MTYRALDVQLNVDEARRPLGDAAYLWFDTLVDGLAAAERAELAGLPAATDINPYAEKGQGKPGELYGLVSVSRSTGEERRALSRDGWAWLAAQLADLPQEVTVRIGRFDEQGFLGRHVLYASAVPVRRSPGWLMLQAQVDAADFADSGGQGVWLRALRSAADRLGPGFGHIEYGRQKGKTALEWFTYGRDVPLPWRDPQRSIAESRERLRGYSWLTIVAAEVADRLGGVAGLTTTGAFARVEALAGGGVWLLATEDFRDWSPRAAEAVFRAVAPVLAPVAPQPRPDFAADEPPVFLVFADPSTV